MSELKRKSPFMDWFKAQYGPRPSELSYYDLRQIIDSQRRILSNRETELAAIEEWETRRDAALKAWCAATEEVK